MKPKPVTHENSRNAGELIVPIEGREETLNELRQVFKKWSTIK